MNPSNPLESIYFINIPKIDLSSCNSFEIDPSIPLPVQKKDGEASGSFNPSEIEPVDNVETPDEEEVATTEEAEVEEETEEESFAEVDNLDNGISESNLDYLTAKDTAADNSDDSANISTNLKQDIKSVLLYMDQLLENLPEDKIVEFAKSDEFVTYKKLFSELGLS